MLKVVHFSLLRTRCLTDGPLYFHPRDFWSFSPPSFPRSRCPFFLSAASFQHPVFFQQHFFNDLFKQCAQVERQFLVEGFGWHIPPSLMVKTSACVPPEPPLDLRRCCGHLSSVNHPEGSMNEPPGENRTEIGQAERREEKIEEEREGRGGPFIRGGEWMRGEEKTGIGFKRMGDGIGGKGKWEE